jgi:hypothetical protein
MGFSESKPVQDFLVNGKLPTVDLNIELATSTIIRLTVAMFILGVSIILVNKIVKNIGAK